MTRLEHNAYCRTYNKEHRTELNKWQREYYKKNPEIKKKYRLTRLRKFYPTFRRLLNDLKHRPCLDCQGWFEPCQMEFDHRDATTKKYEVGNMRGNSHQTIMKEVAKCDIVCSNCHRLRTWNRQNRTKYI